MNGPTIRCVAYGRIRRTENPPRSLSRDRMMSSRLLPIWSKNTILLALRSSSKTRQCGGKLSVSRSTRYKSLWERKRKAYRWLYEFTFGACGFCVSSGCACKDRICQHVAEQADKVGLSFSTGTKAVRFIGENGCVIPPHLRETCTTYLCDKAQKGSDFDRDRYARLKKLCHDLDWKLMELEDAHDLDLRQLGLS
jgi:hypothetical protein